jgi:hypothetical protein
VGQIVDREIYSEAPISVDFDKTNDFIIKDLIDGLVSSKKFIWKMNFDIDSKIIVSDKKNLVLRGNHN